MSSAKDQVHGKFKLFTGELGADLSLGALASEVEAFVAKTKCAPRSIGVEYLDGDRRVVISLGYREGEPAYKIRLRSASLGTAAKLDAPELARLEKAMADAADKQPEGEGLICHELFVTEKREFVMVFMTLSPS
jgi:hypothetical protein